MRKSTYNFIRFSRHLVLLLSLLGAVVVWAAETTEQEPSDSGKKVYKKVGPGGEIIYSDKPMPDSEEVKVPDSTTYKPVQPPAGFTPYQPPVKKPVTKPIVASVAITAPKGDEVIWSAIGELTVSVSVGGGLQAGQQLEYVIDGEKLFTGSQTSHTFTNI